MQATRNARLVRITLLAVALVAVVGAVLLPTHLALAEEAGGYWKRIGVEVVSADDQIQEYHLGDAYLADYKALYQATELCHEMTWISNEEDLDEDSNVVGWHLDTSYTLKATCDRQCPEILTPGETETFTIAVELTDYYRVRREGRSDTMESQGCAAIGTYGGDDSGIDENGNIVLFPGHRSDEVWLQFNQQLADQGLPLVASGEFSFVVPGRYDQPLRIRFADLYGATTWTYEWVEGSAAITNDTVVNTEASKESGESGGWLIPAAIVLGIAAVGGGLALARRGKGAPKPDENDGQKQKSTYRMLVYKDFGGELRAGDAPREVCARIEEVIGGPLAPGSVSGVTISGTAVESGTQARRRDDLTREIKASGESGLRVVETFFDGKYLVARVQVPRQADGAPIDPNRRPTVVFTYANAAKAGTFTLKVAFKLAGEPRIVFVGKGGDGSFSRALGSNRIGLLLGDAQGSPLCFEAANFIKAPTHAEVKGSDARVSGIGERCIDAKRPNAFVYQAPIKNSIPFESIYGTWPMEVELTVSAWNEEGERAEVAASAFLWPEGIFVDTRQVRRERVFRDHLLVDSSDILLSAGTEYNIEGATVEVGAAFKDDKGAVVIDMPNEPGDGSYLKLAPANDALSQKALNPKASRIWYTLGYVWHPTYSEAHEPLGTLELTPLMPLVSKHESDEYRGSIPIRYSKGDRQAQADVVFALRGLGSDLYDADLKAERDRIYRLLAAFKPDDWSRIDAVLARFGRQAEEDQQRLGTAAQRDEAGQTAIQLVKSIGKIQSLQRMRAIRKMVYEAAEVTQVHERVEADSEASLYNGLYLAASTVRWVDDIAFSVWWTALCGPGASAFVEPLMTPLKDWVVGFLEILGLCAFDDEANIPPDDYFTYEGFEKEVLQKQLDGEFMGILMSNTVPTPGSFSWKRLLLGMGATVCYLFYRNCMSDRFNKVNEETGTTEFDLWGALKATTVDLGIFSIKALLSYFIARKASSKMAEVEETSLFSLDEADGPFDRFCVKAAKWFLEDPLKAIGDAADTVADRIPGAVGEVITGNAEVEVVQAAVDGITQSLVGLVSDLSPDATSADQWARGMGSVTVELKDDEGRLLAGPDGKPRTLKVPFLTVVALYVNHVLKELELDIKVDFRGVLPDDPGYTSYDQLITNLEGIDRANWEVSFLCNPATLGTSVQSPYLLGAERPTFDTGIDFHRYVK